MGSRIGNAFHSNSESEGVKVSDNVGIGRNALLGGKGFGVFVYDFLCSVLLFVFCFLKKQQQYSPQKPNQRQLVL